MADFLSVLALAAVCYLLRICFVVVVPAARLPSVTRRALEHLPPAMLTSLVAVTLVAGLSGAGGHDRLTGLVAAAAVALVAARSRSVGWTVAAAVACVLLLDVLKG